MPLPGGQGGPWDVSPAHRLFQEAPLSWLRAAWRVRCQDRAKETYRRLRTGVPLTFATGERRAQTTWDSHCRRSSAQETAIADLRGTPAHLATLDFPDRAPRPRCVSMH